jgi:environmental stress-induced protein Ves
LTDYQVRLATGHRRMRWANGGGWTTEIVAEPSTDRWTWRLSVADVEVDGPFSLFPGIDRTIALLRGGGFALTIGDNDEHVIDTPFRPFDFPGGEATSCRLIDGPVHDLNLMNDPSSARRRLEFTRIAAGAAAELGEVDVVVVVSGQIGVGGHHLGYLDTIRCIAGARLVALGADAVVASVATHFS